MEILRIENLKKHFYIKSGFIKKKIKVTKAVNGISLTINEGETVGLVGESGCGKSTTGRMIVKLSKPTAGNIFFENKDIFENNKVEEKFYKASVQMIFQDSYASLNPRMTAGEIVGEALDIHNICSSKNERKEYIKKIFNDVGLNGEQISRYPHEFSGGQRQRIGIARAICVNPKLIVCDEPVSALDVSIQAQIINMMKKIQAQYGLSYLFISHDLSVVKHISDRVVIMYLGFVLEEAPKNVLFNTPMHPYTQALISSIPNTNPDIKKDALILRDEIDPSLIDKCCPFVNRCDKAMDICYKKIPEPVYIEERHKVMCHLFKEV